MYPSRRHISPSQRSRSPVRDRWDYAVHRERSRLPSPRLMPSPEYHHPESYLRHLLPSLSEDDRPAPRILVQDESSGMSSINFNDPWNGRPISPIPYYTNQEQQLQHTRRCLGLSASKHEIVQHRTGILQPNLANGWEVLTADHFARSYIPGPSYSDDSSSSARRSNSTRGYQGGSELSGESTGFKSTTARGRSYHDAMVRGQELEIRRRRPNPSIETEFSDGTISAFSEPMTFHSSNPSLETDYSNNTIGLSRARPIFNLHQGSRQAYDSDRYGAVISSTSRSTNRSTAHILNVPSDHSVPESETNPTWTSSEENSDGMAILRDIYQNYMPDEMRSSHHSRRR